MADRKTGLWKCYDDAVMREVGSFPTMVQREHTRGYLYFYVSDSAP